MSKKEIKKLRKIIKAISKCISIQVGIQQVLIASQQNIPIKVGGMVLISESRPEEEKIILSEEALKNIQSNKPIIIQTKLDNKQIKIIKRIKRLNKRYLRKD